MDFTLETIGIGECFLRSCGYTAPDAGESPTENFKVESKWRVESHLGGSECTLRISARTLLIGVSILCLRSGSMYASAKSRSPAFPFQLSGNSAEPSSSRLLQISRSVAFGFLVSCTRTARLNSDLKFKREGALRVGLSVLAPSCGARPSCGFIGGAPVRLRMPGNVDRRQIDWGVSLGLFCLFQLFDCRNGNFADCLPKLLRYGVNRQTQALALKCGCTPEAFL